MHRHDAVGSFVELYPSSWEGLAVGLLMCVLQERMTRRRVLLFVRVLQPLRDEERKMKCKGLKSECTRKKPQE